MPSQSSRRAWTPGGGMPPQSQEAPTTWTDPGCQAVTRRFDLTTELARLSAPRDQTGSHRPAEYMEAVQQEMLDFQNAMAAARAHARVHAAVDAAARMAKGTCGICQACGQNIPSGRLQAVPLTSYCLSCQDALEQGRRDRYRRA